MLHPTRKLSPNVVMDKGAKPYAQFLRHVEEVTPLTCLLGGQTLGLLEQLDHLSGPRGASAMPHRLFGNRGDLADESIESGGGSRCIGNQLIAS